MLTIIKPFIVIISIYHLIIQNPPIPFPQVDMLLMQKTMTVAKAAPVEEDIEETNVFLQASPCCNDQGHGSGWYH